jgi:hypothetical protein
MLNMMKKQKSGKIDNNTIKKSLKTKSKSKVYEKMPNDNIFKIDKYRITQDMRFESPVDEENYTKDMFSRNQEFIKFSVLLFLGRFLISVLFSFNDLGMVLESIIIGSAVPTLFLILKYDACELEKLGYNRKLFRYVMEVYITIFTLLNLNYIESFSLDCVLCLNMPTILFNYLLGINFIENAIIQGFNLFIIFAFHGEPDTRIYLRVFYNIISSKLLVLIVQFAFNAISLYFLEKATKEIWALYDSFKKSYNIFQKCMYDDYPHPILVISKTPTASGNRNVYYRNEAAVQLYTNNQKTHTTRKGVESRFFPSSGKNTAADEKILLDDLFEKDSKEQFELELNKCIEGNKKHFDFPFKSVRLGREQNPTLKFKNSSKKITFYEGDLDRFDWYKIVVSQCYWKAQDTLLLHFIKNNEFYVQDFISNFTKNINYEFNSLLESVDKVSERITDFDNIQEKINLRVNSQQEKSNVLSITKSFKKPSLSTIRTFTHNSLTTYREPNQTLIREPSIDGSLWFFYKYNSNYVYDMYLTIKIFNSLLSKRIFTPKHKLNTIEFMNYIKDYFYIQGKVNNFHLFISNRTEEVLFVHYDYFRAIFFNVILFIINNTTNTKDKMLKISLSNNHEYNISNEASIKVEITYTDDKPKIKYNLIQKLLETNSYVNSEKLLKKIDLIDLGLVTVNYLIMFVYDNKLECRTDEYNTHYITFYLKGLKVPIEKEIYSPIKLKLPKQNVAIKHYDNILKNVFKITVDHSKGKHLLIPNQEEEEICKFFLTLDQSDEDRLVDLERDIRTSATIAIRINRCIQTFDHRIIIS